MYFVYSLFIPFFIFSSQAFAQGYIDSLYSKPRTFSTDLQYISYTDIRQSPDNPQLALSSSINVNVNARIYRVYSLSLVYGKGADWSYEGLGLRVDLPGFWFFSGVANDFVRKKKLRNANTYVQVTKMIVHQTGKGNFIDDRIGLGADIFIFGNAYLNVELNILSHDGNQFIAPAVGIGYEF